MKEYGEPGFFITKDRDWGCNPCGEIGLNPVWENEDGTEETGWGFCNLTEVNGTGVDSSDEFFAACRAASFIGTLQASYTSFPYLSTVTEKIVRRDALLGVSITGIMDNPIFLDRSMMREGALLVVEENERAAESIGIRSAARATTVKPSGTASLLLGAVGSGIHPHHARRYFRRITCNPLEPGFRYFQTVNPHMCEEKSDGDWVITFPIECRSDAIIIDDMSAVDFMNRVFDVYQDWITFGTTRDELSHNVSCTVTVEETEWEAVEIHAYLNRDRVAAMSFLPRLGDKIYAHAPREKIEGEADEARWNELISKYQPVDWSKSNGGRRL
jgi:ribonucleoside-diphosphate reductase alpha chain